MGVGGFKNMEFNSHLHAIVGKYENYLDVLKINRIELVQNNKTVTPTFAATALIQKTDHEGKPVGLPTQGFTQSFVLPDHITEQIIMTLLGNPELMQFIEQELYKEKPLKGILTKYKEQQK